MELIVRKRETLIKFIIIHPLLPAQDGREGGERGFCSIHFYCTSISLAAAPGTFSLSLSLSLLFSSLLSLPIPASFFVG